jgi:hypothetical protein
VVCARKRRSFQYAHAAACPYVKIAPVIPWRAQDVVLSGRVIIAGTARNMVKANVQPHAGSTSSDLTHNHIWAQVRDLNPYDICSGNIIWM